MAALDFPASPINNQVFVAPNGVTYIYSSAYTAWQAQPMSAGFVGDFCATQHNPVGFGTSLTTILFGTVYSGNAGGWYNPSNGRWTPPKGRYFLSTYMTGYLSSGVAQVQLQVRKNGVNITNGWGVSSSAGANYYFEVNVNLMVDANGTDWFDVQGATGGGGATAMDCWFTAFPVSPNANMTLGTGDFYCSIFGTGGGVGTTPTTVIYSPSINTGGFYNPANGRWMPPAGRYMITSNFTGLVAASPSLFTNVIRKNGTQIAYNTTQGNPGGVADSAPLDIIVDANGTDWFDQQVYTNAGNTAPGSTVLWFGGFPISGIKGPQGDAPAGALMLYSEQVLSVAAATIAVNVPINAKRIELDFHYLTSPIADIVVGLRGMRAGVPDTSAVYTSTRHYGVSPSTSAADIISGSQWMSIGHARAWGRASIFLPLTALAGYYGSFQGGSANAGGNRLAWNMSLEAQLSPANIDGFQLSCASTNFATGSFLRCWAAT